ncbi:MAG: GGDEF domain-containing protein [Clostridia bacterium]|nr:GGDEF domain-containing protein [Clostridia bacterium]
MSPYFLHYLQSNAVCLVIFGIVLSHNLLRKDRTEKQIKYNLTLIAFMSYFVSDTLWAGVIAGVLPNVLSLVLVLNFTNYLIMAGITFAWLCYAMAVEEVQNRDKPTKLFALLVPFILTSVALIVTYIAAPGSLLDESNKPKLLYNAFLVVVPIIYIISSLVYSLRRVKGETNADEKRKHLSVGLFPLIVIVGGLAQILLLNGESALFCSCCTVFMLIFYIQSMEKQISVDPLTGLNNRGQLSRYLSQSSGAHKDATTFILMIDVNDFKRINDTFGHAEGDRALVIVAGALKQIVDGRNFPTFLGRYGGDEFILIAHTVNEKEIERMIVEIRQRIEEDCFLQQTPYVIFVGIGYDKVGGDSDTFQKCISRADDNLYLDKKNCKLNSQTTFLK